MGLKCVTEQTSICHLLNHVHRTTFFRRSVEYSFNSVIRLDGILFTFEGVIRRFQFAMIEQCFVWNLQWSCQEDFS